MSKNYKLFSSVLLKENANDYSEIKSEFNRLATEFLTHKADLKPGVDNFIRTLISIIDSLKNKKSFKVEKDESGFTIFIDFSHIVSRIRIEFESFPDTDGLNFLVYSSVKEKYISDYTPSNFSSSEKIRLSIDNDHGLDLGMYSAQNASPNFGVKNLERIKSYLKCTDSLQQWFIDTSISTGATKFLKIEKYVSYINGKQFDCTWLPATGFFSTDGSGDAGIEDFYHDTI